MKKFYLLMALVGIFAASFAGAVLSPIVTTDVTSSAWTAVSLGANQSGVRFIAKPRTAGSWKISAASTGTPYYSVATDTVVEFNLNVPKGGTLFYAQSGAATNVIELFVMR